MTAKKIDFLFALSWINLLVKWMQLTTKTNSDNVLISQF